VYIVSLTIYDDGLGYKQLCIV